MVNDRLLKKELIFFLYKKKFLIFYTLIGFSSILLELSLRSVLIDLNQQQLIYNYLPVVIGIFFAFYLNIKVNFIIPKIYLKRSLIYFVIISMVSLFVQNLLRNSEFLLNYDYNVKRIFSSMSFFLIGYFLHLTFSFRKNIKVGVAIYANGYEDLNIIKNKIGSFADFIHVDIVDKTIKKNAKKIEFSKLKHIQKIWPDKEIHTHIMSTRPFKIIKKVKTFSKIIYVHKEIKENLDYLKDYMINSNVVPGIVLHAKNKYSNLENIVDGYDEVMILSIDNPGYSGQKFNKKTFKLINKIDQLKKRKNINLLIDGGVNSKNIKKINCEKIVSGSAVLQSDKPINEIMRLQTVSRYEI